MDTENALDVKRDDIRALISEKTTECSETECSQSTFDQACDEPCVDIVSANASNGLMNQTDVALAHSKGKQINFWTLNSTKDIITAIQIGDDSYFTDYTGKAFELEKEGLESREE